MQVAPNTNFAEEPPPAFEFTPIGVAEKPLWFYWFFPILICLAHFLTLAYLAQQHPFGNYATETDFYHFYAPDAERLAAGQFPTNTYQGPGYPAVLALIAKLTGGDLFTVGKWMSVACAMLCGLLIFVMFSRMFSYWVGLGAQSIAIVSGEFPQFSINAATDVFFLLLCLIVLALFTGEWLSIRWRVAFTGAMASLTYLTRYNGLFLLAACLLAVVLINLFNQSWRERLMLSAILIVAFVAAASPWLWANYKHRGSPLYNTNYLNLATEFYPELVGGETNQDATRALEEKFRSFGDVIRYDPKRMIAHYPANLYKSFRLSIDDSLIDRWVGWAALLGVALALIKRRSKTLLFVLSAGGIYWLLMALNHWETRYYFFLMVLYAGFAVYAISAISKLAGARFWNWNPPFADATVVLSVPALIGFALFVALWAMSFTESRKDVTKFLAAQPVELIAAQNYLMSVNPHGERLRIVARKPHLPYLSRNEWVFFPQVKSLEEFRAWVESHDVDYIAISKRELKERKELSALGDPKKAPHWLKAAWVNDDPMFILYRPQKKGE